MSAILRNAIVAKLEEVEGIGKVHPYERYADDMSDLESLYVTDGVLLGWFVSRVAVVEKHRGFGAGTVGQPNMRTTSWRICGYMSLKDSNQSELLFDDLIDRIIAAIRDDESIYGIVASISTEDQTGCSLDDLGPVIFAGVLCHCAKLKLITTEYF